MEDVIIDVSDLLLVLASMFTLLRCLLHLLPTVLKTRTQLQLEILALRHQLCVLERKVPRPKLTLLDRWLWVVLSHLWSDWKSAIVIVKPKTVMEWHRQGFRRYWTWKSQRLCRPNIPPEVRELIRSMSRTNLLWGAPRLPSEFLKLGIEVSQATVATKTGSTLPNSADIPP